MTTRNQNGNNVSGVGILVEGGDSTPSVTIENNSVHDFNNWGIAVETSTASSSELNATVKANYVNASSGSGGIFLGNFATATVTGNWVTGGIVATYQVTSGIAADSSAAGSISGNTIVSSPRGIVLVADGVSVVSNKMLNTDVGIDVFSSAATVTGNTITGTSGPDAIGINFNCLADGNVHSNTLTDVVNALSFVPGSLSTSNSYFNVATIRSSC